MVRGRVKYCNEGGNLNIKDHSVALQEGQMFYSLLQDKELVGFFKRTLIFNYIPDFFFIKSREFIRADKLICWWCTSSSYLGIPVVNATWRDGHTGSDVPGQCHLRPLISFSTALIHFFSSIFLFEAVILLLNIFFLFFF